MRDETTRGFATVLVVDDHHAFGDLLALALDHEADFEVVGVADTPQAAVQAALRTRPDIVVMDIEFADAGEDGLDATRRIRTVVPDTFVVVVSAHHGEAWTGKARLAGASAFVTKSGALAELLTVLRCAATATEPPPPPGPAAERRSAGGPELTRRERDVLAMMGTGAAPAEIAATLHISIETCRGYVKAIHSKLDARSQLESVVKAQRLGLVDVGA